MEFAYVDLTIITSRITLVEKMYDTCDPQSLNSKPQGHLYLILGLSYRHG